MLLFNKWSNEGIVVKDEGLKRYITIKDVIVPKSQGRAQKYKFGKSKSHIIERLMNKVPVSGHKGRKHWKSSAEHLGSGHTLANIMIKTLEIIERNTKQNPIQVVVNAVENSSPREETITIQYGGTRHPKAVDTSPQRRVDLSLRWITQGAYAACTRSRTKIWQALANEITAAARMDVKSQAYSKKLETERQAAASR